jgi:hypothetical protein
MKISLQLEIKIEHKAALKALWKLLVEMYGGY